MTREYFLETFQYCYNTFNREFNSKQADEYFKRLSILTNEEFGIVIDCALKKVARFPLITDLIKIGQEKSFFQNRYEKQLPFVTVECFCGTSVVLRRDKVNLGVGSFQCPNNFYDKPTSKQRLCSRSYSYALIRDHCKERNGVIWMKEQRLPVEEIPMFEKQLTINN